MKNYKFNAQEVADKLVLWLRDYFDNNGNPLNAVIGISGGKDSTVVAAALVKSIGADRVYGILMPNGTQADIDDSYKVCEFLGLKPYICNIENAYNGIAKTACDYFNGTNQARTNLGPMMRVSMLKFISQCVNGRFTCNANLSERYVGWYTLGGDSTGDVFPLANLTVTEVIAVGKALGLPDWMVEKKPADGLCGKTDEDKFGFSYAVLDHYIRTGECDDTEVKTKIDERHKNNLFKLQPMPEFDPNA